MTLRRFNTVIKSNGMKSLAGLIVVLAVFTSGCAVSEKTNSVELASDNLAEPFANDEFDLLEEELAEQVIKIADPLEPLNRVIFGFNDILYIWVLTPCAETVEGVVPEPVRIGIRNFFNNLTTPVRFVNCHLQGKTAVADIELNRFLVNTTAGVLGFGDPAKDQHGLEPPGKEDFGQTLATYGVGDGFYIVWPLLGPSTLRDSVGKVGGLFLNPIYYIESTEVAIGFGAVMGANESSFHLGEYETLKSDALDPYVAVREAYIQYRRKQIRE